MENSLALYSYGNMLKTKEKINLDTASKEIKLNQNHSSSSDRTLLYVCATM